VIGPKKPAISGRESHYLGGVAGGKRQHMLHEITRKHAKSSHLKTRERFDYSSKNGALSRQRINRFLIAPHPTMS